MKRQTLVLVLAVASGVAACDRPDTCKGDDPDCLLAGLVVEQEGQALELATVPAETLARHYPARTRATAAFAVGDEGTILRFDGEAWQRTDSGLTSRLRAVWGADVSAVWAVGDGGRVVRWDGADWVGEQSGVAVDLNALHGTSASDVWAVGADGVIVHWDGAAWTQVPTGVQQPLTGVFAAASDDAWAVGGAGVVLRWDGTGWTPVWTPFPAGDTISAVRGTGASDVWAVGRNGSAMHFDGAAWSEVRAPSSVWLHALGGSGPADLWGLADAGSSLWRLLGGQWVRGTAGAGTDLRALWFLAPDDGFVVGSSIEHWNGRAWSPVDAPAHPTLRGLFGFGPAPDGGTGGGVLGAWRTGVASSTLGVLGLEGRADVELGFDDPAGCTPSFCFSVCTLRSHCSTAASCTKAVRDGRRSGTWRSALGFTVEPADQSLTFDLSVAVLSDPTCAELPAELEPGAGLAGAGPNLPMVLEPEPEPDPGDDGPDCSLYEARCGTSGGVQSTGSWYPKVCACPAGMSDEGGSHDNQLCGLPGTGYDCKFCSCD